MEKSYVIQGMSCLHCVSRVKSSLEKLSGVIKAEVTLEPPQVKLFSNEPLADKVVEEAVKKAGHYQILS
ncbi:MAG: heavy-metal-associated domain-containing protein [Chitinophagaceae bacterium]